VKAGAWDGQGSQPETSPNRQDSRSDARDRPWWLCLYAGALLRGGGDTSPELDLLVRGRRSRETEVPRLSASDSGEATKPGRDSQPAAALQVGSPVCALPARDPGRSPSFLEWLPAAPVAVSRSFPAGPRHSAALSSALRAGGEGSPRFPRALRHLPKALAPPAATQFLLGFQVVHPASARTGLPDGGQSRVLGASLLHLRSTKDSNPLMSELQDPPEIAARTRRPRHPNGLGRRLPPCWNRRALGSAQCWPSGSRQGRSGSRTKGSCALQCALDLRRQPAQPSCGSAALAFPPPGMDGRESASCPRNNPRNPRVGWQSFRSFVKLPA
jgi:hypothetical protein